MKRPLGLRREPQHATAAVVAVAILLTGCASLESIEGAYDGSDTLITAPVGAASSGYEPNHPYSEYTSGLLVRQLPMSGAPAGTVSTWAWLVGPGQRTNRFSLGHPILIEVVSGRGEIQAPGGPQALTGGVEVAVSERGNMRITNLETDRQLDLRVHYFP